MKAETCSLLNYTPNLQYFCVKTVGINKHFGADTAFVGCTYYYYYYYYYYYVSWNPRTGIAVSSYIF